MTKETFANPMGHQFFSDARDLKHQHNILTDQVGNQESTLANVQSTLATVLQRLHKIEKVTDAAYPKVKRSRCEPGATRGEQESINAGNAAAHHGEVIMDAFLYSEHYRTDLGMFPRYRLPCSSPTVCEKQWRFCISFHLSAN